MSRSSCLACKAAGTRPKYVEHMPSVVYYPPIGMPGRPTIEGHRLNAAFMAGYVYRDGIAQTARDYVVEPAALLVACWWAGLYGKRHERALFGAWAEVADGHLCYSCIRIPAPPRKTS